MLFPVQPLGVVPVLVGPIQVLLAILPGLLVALLSGVVALFKPSAMKRALVLLWRLKVPVLGAAAAVVALVHLVPLIFPQSRAVTEAEAARHEWTMFRGGPDRRGAVPGSPDPAQGGLVWAFDSEVQTFYSSPTVVGNRVYVTSADKGIYRDRGAIYCLDADTGAVVWKTQPDGYRATFSSPAVSGGYLVCGEGLHFTTNARVFCFDVSLEGQGKVLWEYETKSHVESSPCIYEGRVYIGAGDDGYYCFDLEPGADGQATVVWHVPGDRYPDAETPPAVVDGKVFVGLGMAGNAVCCLDAETGDEVWRVETPYPVMCPPTVVGDRVFVGMGNGNFIQTAEEVEQAELRKLANAGADQAELDAAKARLQPAGEVWGISISDPADRWAFKVSRTVLGAVAAADGNLYFGSRDGNLYCVSQQGRPVGRWDAHGPIMVSPACTGGHVYFVTASGRLYGLETETMTPVWDVPLGTEGVFLSSPAVARGHVYVGTEKYGLLCVGEPGGAGKPPIWAGALAGPGLGGTLDGSTLPERGSLLWGYPDREAAADAPVTIVAPAAAGEVRLFVPFADRPKKGLTCLTDTEQGREPPQELWFFETPNGVWQSPACSEDAVLCADGSPGDAGRQLYCLDSATGEERWSVALDADASGAFVLWEDGVCVQGRAGSLACIDLSGAVRWSRDVGPLVGPPDRAGAIMVVATESPAALLALDSEGGEVLWEAPLDAAPTAGPVVRKKGVLVGTAQGLEARSLLDGSLAWRAEIGAVAGAFTVGRSHVACVTAQSELVLIDPQDGTVAARVPGALPSVTPMLVRGTALFAAEGSLHYYRVEDGSQGRWMDTSWLGALSSPMILVRSHVYFATEERGFIRAGKWQ